MSGGRILHSRQKRHPLPEKEALLTSMQQLQEAVDYIDWKQGFYDDVLSGKTAYYSNLIPETTPDASESTAS